MDSDVIGIIKNAEAACDEQYGAAVEKSKEALREAKADARAKAEALINEATIHTNQLINEHEIMQQAYAQANEVVTMATRQAQEILDNATIEANSMRSAAMQYTDDILANVENLLNQTMRSTMENHESFMGALNHYNDIVNANRVELNPPEPDTYIGEEGVAAGSGADINLDLM